MSIEIVLENLIPMTTSRINMFSSKGNNANYFQPKATWKQIERTSHAPRKGMLHLQNVVKNYLLEHNIVL